MNAIDILKYGHQTVLQTIDGFPETAWETPGICGSWYGMDYSLDDLIVLAYYGHKREHSAQIAAFRDRL